MSLEDGATPGSKIVSVSSIGQHTNQSGLQLKDLVGRNKDDTGISEGWSGLGS
jgi:hypothetical protein